MFVRLRVQGFESSVDKEFHKKKLVNSKTVIYSPHLKGLVLQELTYFYRDLSHMLKTFFSLTLTVRTSKLVLCGHPKRATMFG